MQAAVQISCVCLSTFLFDFISLKNKLVKPVGPPVQREYSASEVCVDQMHSLYSVYVRQACIS